jgi:medium-chain acyl-[acyl-carrier-protein] hydrolase
VRVQAFVDAFTTELGDLFERPFALFGHSMGALLSFELARALWKLRRKKLVHLFVSGRRAPQLPDDHAPAYALPDAEFVAKLRSMQGTPVEVLEHPELMALALLVLRADFELCETYVYEPALPLGCPVTAFAGLRDRYSSVEMIRPWKEQTNKTFDLISCDGDHFFIHSREAFIRERVFAKLEADMRQREWMESEGNAGTEETSLR